MQTVGSRCSGNEVGSRSKEMDPKRNQLEYYKYEENGTRKDQLEFNVKFLWTRSATVITVN